MKSNNDVWMNYIPEKMGGQWFYITTILDYTSINFGWWCVFFRENGTLLVHYDDANIDGLSIATNEKKLQIFVSSREEIRIKENKFFNDFLNKIEIESTYSGKFNCLIVLIIPSLRNFVTPKQ